MTNPKQTRARIDSYVMARYGLTRKQYFGHCRNVEFVWPRWVGFGLMKLAGFNMAHIGRLYRKNRDTIRNGMRRIQALTETDARYRRDWDEVKKEMGRV